MPLTYMLHSVLVPLIWSIRSGLRALMSASVGTVMSIHMFPSLLSYTILLWVGMAVFIPHVPPMASTTTPKMASCRSLNAAHLCFWHADSIWPMDSCPTSQLRHKVLTSLLRIVACILSCQYQCFGGFLKSAILKPAKRCRLIHCSLLYD